MLKFGINLGFVGLPHQQLAHHPEVFLGLPIDLTSQHLAFGKLDGDSFFIHAWCHATIIELRHSDIHPFGFFVLSNSGHSGMDDGGTGNWGNTLQPASLSQVRAHWRMAAPLLSSVWTSLTMISITVSGLQSLYRAPLLETLAKATLDDQWLQP